MDENKYTENENISADIPARPFILIPLSSTVIFPGQLISFDLFGNKSVAAVLSAMETDSEVFFACQKSGTENPGKSDIFSVGTLSRIKQMVRMPNNGVRILVQGMHRMVIDSFAETSPYFRVILKSFNIEPDDDIALAATKSAVRSAMRQAVKVNPKYSDKEPSMSNMDTYIYEMAGLFYQKDDEKQRLLSLPSLTKQLDDICAHIVKFSEIEALKREIEMKVRKNIDKNQHEYYLREQLKVIHDELGDGEDELEAYHDRIEKKKLPEHAREKAEKELNKMSKMSMTSPESAVSRGYLDLILDLPWGNVSKDKIDLAYARTVLDEDHYGLEKIKERIIEFLAVQSLKNNMKAPILCFVGPPGVGKTSVVTSIARAAKRKFVQMSLGGVRDEAEIRGHRRTYIGSLPGRIIAGLRDVGVDNPVFLLDEIDKMSSDFRGDPASALLEVLDTNQNSKFKDHFLEMPYDLSKVIFITTANTIDTIAPPLLDRMEVIELTGYTYAEKLQIAKNYLIPKQCDFNGVAPELLAYSDEAIIRTVQQYTRESGVRNLERQVGTVVRKIAVKYVSGGKKKKKYEITEKNFEEYLGKPKYREDMSDGEDTVGKATGLAWTSVGGTTLDIEVAVMDGKGDIKLTGNLGDVMKESVQAAVSYIRSHAEEYNIPAEMFTKYDIHVHFPEGAVPKDGPSAGITVATAILSALTGRKVASDITMTGEITLRGKVLAIGGLKEKSLAALRYGKRRMIIPKENEKDLDDIPGEVKDRVKIILASRIDQVFSAALI